LLQGKAMRAVLPHLGLTRWAFDVDLLFQLQRLGYRIVEVPTTWQEPGGSKLRIVRTSFEMFVAIGRLRMLYSPLRWIVTVYDATLGRIIHLKEST
jgi:dolichyl-phosphate beta-glucosyltransferase